eukprot:gene6358-12858_t
MSVSRRLFTPAFKAIIKETARKCFGNLPPSPGVRTGFKYLKQNLSGALIADHYLPDVERDFRNYAPDFQTELEERREAKLMKLRRRGKGPPKKGHGKRAGRKKK